MANLQLTQRKIYRWLENQPEDLHRFANGENPTLYELWWWLIFLIVSKELYSEQLVFCRFQLLFINKPTIKKSLKFLHLP